MVQSNIQPQVLRREEEEREREGKKANTSVSEWSADRVSTNLHEEAGGLWEMRNQLAVPPGKREGIMREMRERERERERERLTMETSPSGGHGTRKSFSRNC